VQFSASEEAWECEPLQGSVGVGKADETAVESGVVEEGEESEAVVEEESGGETCEI
jgi:hypothetical protein